MAGPGNRRLSPAARGLLVATAVFACGVVVAETVFRASHLHEAALESDGYVARPIKVRRFEGPIEVVTFGSSRVRAGFSTVEAIEAGLELCGRPVIAYNMGVSRGMGRATLAMASQVLARPGAPPKLALVYDYAKNVSSRFSARVERGDWAISRGSFPPSAVVSMLRAGMPTSAAAFSLFAGPLHLVRMRAPVLRALSGIPPVPDRLDHPYFRGWVPLAPVPSATQHRRMHSRSRKERKMFDRRRARYVDIELDALEEAVRRLRAAGTEVVVLDAPAPSEMYRAAAGSRLYTRYLRRLKQIARRHGSAFADHSQPAVLSDPSFSDEHHLSSDGAGQYTRWVMSTLVAPKLGCRAPPHPPCVPSVDVHAHGWDLSGFRLSAKSEAVPRTGRVLTSRRSSPPRQSTALSPPFRIDHDHLVVDVAGIGESARVELWVEGRRVAEGTTEESPVVHPLILDTRDHTGRFARLRLISSGEGFVAVSRVRQCTWSEVAGD